MYIYNICIYIYLSLPLSLCLCMCVCVINMDRTSHPMEKSYPYTHISIYPYIHISIYVIIYIYIDLGVVLDCKSQNDEDVIS